MKKQPTIFVAARITATQKEMLLAVAEKIPGTVTNNFSAALRYVLEDWARISGYDAGKEQQS